MWLAVQFSETPINFLHLTPSTILQISIFLIFHEILAGQSTVDPKMPANQSATQTYIAVSQGINRVKDVLEITIKKEDDTQKIKRNAIPIIPK